MQLIKVFSFDIFDTCLVRSCGLPSAVFDILSLKILGKNAERSALTDFAYERINGERLARKKYINGECEEVTLDQIYDCCDFTLFTKIDKSIIMNMELDIEREMLQPVYSIKERIDKLRSKGNRIVFISDMYLPEYFIKSILIHYGFLKGKDRIYISSTVKKSKVTGNLYRFVKSDMGIKFYQWQHYGDNKYSDVNIPKKLGIHVKLVRNRFSLYENIVRDRDVLGFDNSITRYAGLMRATRLHFKGSSYVKIASQFIAPIYVPYVFNIFQDAKNRGIKHLYFLSRDGYIFYKIAEIFHPIFENIDLHYLCVSRRSLYLPGMKEISSEEVKNMFLGLEGVNIADVLDRLQLESDKLKKKFGRYSDVELIDNLFKDREFVEQLTIKHKEQRNLCFKYLDQEGLSRGNCAIIDESGTRKCQIAINRILESEGRKHVFGYYLEALDNRLPGTDYHADFYSDRWGRCLKNNPLYPHDLFEQYFCITDQFRIGSYKLDRNGQVIPIKEHSIITDYNRKVSQINVKVCQFFAKQFVKILPQCIDEIESNALYVYEQFAKNPLKNYLKAFKELSVSESQIHSSKVFKGNSFLMSLFHNNKTFWRQAQIVNSSHIPVVINIYYYLKELYKREFRY